MRRIGHPDRPTEGADGRAVEHVTCEAGVPLTNCSRSEGPSVPDATPTCPKCGASMRRRTATKGDFAGRSFWGCVSYPACRGIVDDTSPTPRAPVGALGHGEEPNGRGSSRTSPVRARRRAMWPAYGSRPGWTTTYITAGGRLRSWDPAGGGCGDPQLAPSLSQAAMFSTSGAAQDVSRSVTLDVLRGILTRGDRPPVDPLLERAILKAGAVDTRVTPSPFIGDLGARLADNAPLPDAVAALDAAMWREPFVFDQAALDHLHGPLVHPDLELPWLTERLPAVAGPAAGQWLAAQAWVDTLVGTQLESTGARRADFLLAPPGRAPLVIEIDGRQHEQSAAVDAARGRALATEGIEVIRLTAAESRASEGPKARNLAAHFPPTTTEPSPEAIALVWGPSVAARLARGILEALESGWLSGASWHIDAAEPVGIGAEAILCTVRLLAALDAVWGTSHAPDYISVGTGQDVVAFRRDGWDYLAMPTGEPRRPDVKLTIEPFRGPFHRLPDHSDVPQIVIRSVSLPIDIAEPRLEGGERHLPPDAVAIPSEALKTILRSVFAKQDFLPRDEAEPRGQERALRRLLAGLDTAVLLPTGGGKSLIYQLAGLLLPGRTLVVDPIISLIDDQLDGLRSQGIDRAIGITRADTAAGMIAQKLDAVRTGDALFCFIAPERLQQKQFRDAIRTLTVGATINLCVVDEAHCVSEWGHDFRPSYLDLGRVLRSVSSDSSGSAPPILALTGTASRVVLRDMLIELSIDRADPAAIITPDSFDRPELTFEVIRAGEGELVPCVVGAIQALPTWFRTSPTEFFRPHGEASFGGIVFCQTKTKDRGVFALRDELGEAFNTNVGFYAGGWTPASGIPSQDWEAVKRDQAAAFKHNDRSLFVATKAYGMGIDKPNVRFIVHAGVSSSLEAYYQEAGRAGRDGKRARCIIVHDEAGREFHDWAFGDTFRGIETDVEALKKTLSALGPVGERGTVQVPMGGDKRAETSLHRLRLLGVVSGYLVDWGEQLYEVHLRPIDADGVDRAFVDFVRRSSPARAHVYAVELRSNPGSDLQTRILENAQRLVTYIYETIVASRRRGLNEMVALADRSRSDADVRSSILSYLSLGKVAAELEVLIDAEPFSFEHWQAVLNDLETLDDARDLRGASARLLESAPDNPGLLLARGLAEAMVVNGELNVFTASIGDAITSAKSRFGAAEEDVAALLEWLAVWSHERRPAWASLVYLMAERTLDAHLDSLESAELSAIADQERETVDELGIVLTRRMERHARVLDDAVAQITKELV